MCMNDEKHYWNKTRTRDQKREEKRDKHNWWDFLKRKNETKRECFVSIVQNTGKKHNFNMNSSLSFGLFPVLEGDGDNKIGKVYIERKVWGIEDIENFTIDCTL